MTSFYYLNFVTLNYDKSKEAKLIASFLSGNSLSFLEKHSKLDT